MKTKKKQNNKKQYSKLKTNKQTKTKKQYCTHRSLDIFNTAATLGRSLRLGCVVEPLHLDTLIQFWCVIFVSHIFPSGLRGRTTFIQYWCGIFFSHICLRGRTTSPEYIYSIPVCHIFALSYRIKHYIMLSNSMSITIYHICSCIYNLINVAAHIILLPTCTFIWPAQLSHMDWMRPM